MSESPEDRYQRELARIRKILDRLPDQIVDEISDDLLNDIYDLENTADRIRYAVTKVAGGEPSKTDYTNPGAPKAMPIFGDMIVTGVDSPEGVDAALKTIYDYGGGTLIIPDEFPANINTQRISRDWEGRHLRVVGFNLGYGPRSRLIDPGLNRSAINFNSTGGTLMVEGISVNGWENQVLTNSGRWGRLIVKDCDIIGGSRSLGIWEAKEPIDRKLREVWIINTKFGSSTGSHCIYIHGRDIAAYVVNSEFGNAPVGKEALKCISGLAVILDNRMTDKFDINPGPGSPVMKRIQSGYSLIMNNDITIHRDGVVQTVIHIGTGRRSAHGCWLPPYAPFTSTGKPVIYEIPEGESRGLGADDRFWDYLDPVDLGDPHTPYSFRHYVMGNKIRIVGDPQSGKKTMGFLMDTNPKQTNSMGFEVPRARNRAHLLWVDNNSIEGFGDNPSDKIYSGPVGYAHGIKFEPGLKIDLPVLPSEVPWATADEHGDEFAKIFLPGYLSEFIGNRTPIALFPDWLPPGEPLIPIKKSVGGIL